MSKFEINKLYIELTQKCNLKCRHCYNNSNERESYEISQDELCKLLFIVSEYSNINRVIVSGGEVSIYRYTEHFLKDLCTKELPFTMITNGIVFPLSLYRLFEDSRNQVQISLEGPTHFENDYVRGVGSFDKAIDTTKKLVNNNIATFFRFSLTSLNYNKIEDMVLLAINNGVKMVTFSNLFPYGRCKENEDLFIDNNQLIVSLSQLEMCKEKYLNKIHIDIPDKVIGGCPIANKSDNIGINARIDVHGNLYLCQMFNSTMLASGNIKDRSIEEILSSDQNQRVINLINSINAMRDECHKCFAFPICRYGCPAIGLSNNYIWGSDGVCDCRKHIMRNYLHNESNRDTIEKGN